MLLIPYLPCLRRSDVGRVIRCAAEYHVWQQILEPYDGILAIQASKPARAPRLASCRMCQPQEGARSVPLVAPWPPPAISARGC